MTPAQAAAFRLLTTLPVRTHLHVPRQEIKQTNYRRPVKVGDRVFMGVHEAIKVLRVSGRTLYKMLDDGRAKYVDE